MAGLIALVGGDEFRRYCAEMDREILAAAGRSPARVVVLPTAAVNGPVKAAYDGVTHFNGLGGEAQPLMILDREQANDEVLIQRIADADLIYFTGGNPGHLLETLQGSQLLAELGGAVNRGAILAGSSAGAMVMGSQMRRPRAGDWTPALGIVPGVCVLPHHERSNPAQVAEQIGDRLSEGLTVFGIDAQTGCLGQPGNWRVVGSGKVTVYRSDGWEAYQSGDTITDS